MAGVTYYSSLTSASDFIRQCLREKAEEEGGLMADVRVPAVGHYLFLTADDQQVAVNLGLNSFEAVYRARDSGQLRRNERPEIVFFPEEEFLDRDVNRTDEKGYWRFLTRDDAQIAASQYGGMHGFDERPTASQIYRLGRLLTSYGLEESSEPTRRIEIAWNPGHDDPLDEGPDPILAPRKVNKAAPRPIPHNPTNGDPGGSRDQTCHHEPHMYDSAYHNGIYITVDRSPARVRDEQPHKLWIYTKSGWNKWSHHKDMDWDNREKIKALNRWRNQGYLRAKIFGLSRTEPREEYSAQERQWLKDFVVAHRGQAQPNTVPRIARGFNERFESFRSESGIMAMMDRLRKEYHREQLQGKQKRDARAQEATEMKTGKGKGKEKAQVQDSGEPSAGKKRKRDEPETVYVSSDASESEEDEEQAEGE